MLFKDRQKICFLFLFTRLRDSSIYLDYFRATYLPTNHFKCLSKYTKRAYQKPQRAGYWQNPNSYRLTFFWESSFLLTIRFIKKNERNSTLYYTHHYCCVEQSDKRHFWKILTFIWMNVGWTSICFFTK